MGLSECLIKCPSNYTVQLCPCLKFCILILPDTWHFTVNCKLREYDYFFMKWAYPNVCMAYNLLLCWMCIQIVGVYIEFSATLNYKIDASDGQN